MAPRPPLAEAPTGPLLTVEAPSVCCYAQHAVFFMVWLDSPSEATVDEVHEALRLFVERIPTGFSVISIVERGARPPSPENRARIVAFQNEIGDTLKRLVFLVDGMGFVASLVLTAATSFTAARRARFPQDVTRTPEAAAERLLRDRHVAARFTRETLLASIARARADAAERARRRDRDAGA